MALRFRKRIKIAPGVSINLSKSGISASVGKPGATINLKPGRESKATAGIPGSGIYVTERASRIPSAPIIIGLAILAAIYLIA